MCTEINCARRGADGDLSRVGADKGGGRGWSLSAGEVINRIDSNEWEFFVQPQGAGGAAARAPVMVKERLGHRYLTTKPDDVPPNNLRNLPDNSVLDTDLEPGWPDSFPPARAPRFLRARAAGRAARQARYGGGADAAHPVALAVLPAGSVQLTVEAPWPAELEVRILEADPSRNSPLQLLLKSPTVTSRWPQQDDAGWWSTREIEPTSRTASRWTITVALPTHMRSSTRPIAVEIKSVSLNSQCDLSNQHSDPLRLELFRRAPRRRLTNLSKSEIAALAAEVELAVGGDHGIHHLHTEAFHDRTRTFLLYHRDLVGRLEQHLTDRGLHKFVPLPFWSPSEKIPGPFRKVINDKDVHGRNTTDYELDDASPGMGTPLNLMPPLSFVIPGDDEFVGALAPWHNEVHEKVGGAMAQPKTSARALIFYPWHAYVDDLWWFCQVGPTA